MLGVHDDRVDAARRARRCAARWPGRGSRGRTSWAVRTSGRGNARSRTRVERLHGQPLEVHDVRAARAGRARARRACPGTWRASFAALRGRDPRRRDAAVEALVDRVALGARARRRRRSARDQAHPRSRPRERRAQRVVVGRGVGGGIDDVDAQPAGDNRSRRGGRGLLLRREHRAARAARALPGRDRGRARGAAVRDRGARARQRLERRLGRRGARATPPSTEVIALRQRRGQGRERHARCCSGPAGATRCCSTRTPSCARRGRGALHAALDRAPAGGRRGRAAAAPRRRRVSRAPGASRRPGPRSSARVFLHRRLHRAEPRRPRRARSTGRSRPRCSCASRRRARSATSTRRSSSTPTRSTSASACATPGWATLYVPAAAAVHHEQLSTGAVPERRIVELSRNRDRYMRKHHSPAAAAGRPRAHRLGLRAARRSPPLVLPGHSPRRYWRHVTATLRPDRGEGLREAAVEHNRGRRL